MLSKASKILRSGCCLLLKIMNQTVLCAVFDSDVRILDLCLKAFPFSRQLRLLLFHLLLARSFLLVSGR